MEGISNLLNKTKTNMAEHVSRLERDLATIRTGRASAGLLENIRVDYYGTPTPIKQMAIINVLDAKTLEVQPWDISSINDIDKALQKADFVWLDKVLQGNNVAEEGEKETPEESGKEGDTDEGI